MKQFEVLQWASSFLQKHNRETLVAERLLQHHLNMSQEHYYLNMRENIAEKIVEQFKADIEEHALTGKPYQHIIGYEYFYGRQFTVNEQVLIPRQETEELVQLVIQHYERSEHQLTFVDVGTGSGVIAITLALELPNINVYATDISKQALKIAKHNADKFSANVHFLHGDFLRPIIEQRIYPHVIISNPPYISRRDEQLLQDTVLKYDPHIALFAQNNGLQAYETILKQTAKVMKRLQNIYFEIGFDQGKAVSDFIKLTFPQAHYEVIKDINKKDRMIHVHF